MTREECLAKIDPKYHDLADALQKTYAVDWGRLFSYLARVLPELFDILFGPSIILDSKKEAGEECCAELAEALCDAECAAEEND